MNVQRFLRSVLCVSGLMAFGFFPGEARSDEFTDNLDKWNRMRPAHFQYRYEQICYCIPSAWLVEAEGDKVVKATLATGVEGMGPGDLRRYSIDSLFRLIKRHQAEAPYRLIVAYDREFGYPLSFFVDPEANMADDEYSISIRDLKAIIPGLSLSNDTVYTLQMRNIPAERRSLRIANTGDTAFSLDSIEMSVAPSDTFSNLGVALRFDRTNQSGGPRVAQIQLGLYPKYDTVEVFKGALVPPGGEILLERFESDICFCLIKTGTRIGVGDSITLMLRLNFSRGPGMDGGFRAYVYVKSIFTSTSAIPDHGTRGRERAEASRGFATGYFRVGERFYGLDGGRVENKRNAVRPKD